MIRPFPRRSSRTARVLLALAFSSAPLAAQEFGTWHVLGPFDHPQGAAEIASAGPVERALRRKDGAGPDLEAEHRGRSGPVRWTPVVQGDDGGRALDVGRIDLAASLAHASAPAGWSDKAVAYLYRRIDAAGPLDLDLSVGSDDGLRLWANGELVIDRAAARALSVHDHRVTLSLQAGANHLLAKVTNEGGSWAFRISPPRSAPAAAIDAAIERGVASMIDAQLLDGTWGYHAEWGAGHPAFALYVLLECGVSPDDPALRLARNAIEVLPSATTYARASIVLARTAAGAGKGDLLLERSLAQLLDDQESSGRFGYPVKPDGFVLADDLSNTLFAALAYRAASKRGLEVPEKAWIDLARGALGCLSRPVDAIGTGGTKPRRSAGFGYTPGEKPTGSMTTAGISILALAEEALGKRLPPAQRAEVASARAQALLWLEDHMTWEQNPGGGAHHYFHLYGIERVGTLLATPTLGGLDWYASGASWLVESQRTNGAWRSGAALSEEPMDTLLALLFLRRATRPVSGVPARRTTAVVEPSTRGHAADATRTSDAGTAEISIRARGGPAFALSLADLRADLRRELSPTPETKLDVAGLDFLARPTADPKARPTVVGSLAGGKRTLAELSALELRHEFDTSGVWAIGARLRLAGSRERVLESAELYVRVQAAFDVGRLAYVSDPGRSVVRGATPRIEASSSAIDHAASRAADGSYATAWRSDAKDAQPVLRFVFERAVGGDRLLLSHAAPRASASSEARALAGVVVLNGKRRIEFRVDRDPLAKTVVDLPGLPIRDLEVRITAVVDGVIGAASVGWSEVEIVEGR